MRWSSDSCSALAIVRPSSSRMTVREAATTARSSRSRYSLPAVCATEARSFQSASRTDRQQLVGHGQEGIGRHRRLADRLVRSILRLNGLSHRLQPAAEQLLGDRDLLGPQRRQHGVAVHGRRGCDRTLAPRRAAVALAGTSRTGTTRAAATAWRTIAAALRRRALLHPGRGDCRRACAGRSPSSSRSRRRLSEPGARITDTSGARFGVPLTSMRPSTLSGERAGFAAVRERTSMPSRPTSTSARNTAPTASPSGTRAPSTAPLGCRAPAARQVHDPSPRLARQFNVDVA